MKRAAAVLSALVLLSACSGHSGGSQGGTTAPGATSSTTGQGSADDAAASFEHAASTWVATIENTTASFAKYPDELSTKNDSAAQLAAQTQDCDAAQKAEGTAGRVPVLDSVPAGTSTLYPAAVARAKQLDERAKPLRDQLAKVVRFCTWLGTLDTAEQTAVGANAQLFTDPLRYSGTITVNKVKHTCPTGASCYTPDQTLWPRIAQLWQKQGEATAQGAHVIQKQKLPCLIAGWERACDLVVQNKIAYESWANKYAKAFQDGQKQSLQAAAATISTVGVEFDQDVLKPMTALPGIYKELSPNEKYNARTSLVGEDLWITQIKSILATLHDLVSQLG